jgi:hypothetical protein
VPTRGWNFRVRHRKPVRQEKLLVQLFVVIKSRPFKEVRLERHEHFRLQVFVFARQRKVSEVRFRAVFVLVAAGRRFLLIIIIRHQNREREREQKRQRTSSTTTTRETKREREERSRSKKALFTSHDTKKNEREKKQIAPSQLLPVEAAARPAEALPSSLNSRPYRFLFLFNHALW